MRKRYIILSLLIPNIAYGDMLYVPKWTFDPVKQEACYNFDQAKQLVLLDTQLQLFVGQITALQQGVDALQQSVKQYQLALTAADKQHAEDAAYSKDLESKLKKSTEEREHLAAQARWAWVGVGAAALVGAATAFGVWLDRR